MSEIEHNRNIRVAVKASRSDLLDLQGTRRYGRFAPSVSLDMAKKPTPHPILLTSRLRLRQFREDDADAMHE
jgi:hypothetical protein